MYYYNNFDDNTYNNIIFILIDYKIYNYINIKVVTCDQFVC